MPRYRTTRPVIDPEKHSEKYSEIYERIFHYAKEGNLDELKNLLDELREKKLFEDIGCYYEIALESLLRCVEDDHSKLPWHWVTFYKHQAILNHIYDSTIRSTYDEATKFYLALCYNQLEPVTKMCKADQKTINQSWQSYYFSGTPLFIAAQNGYLEMVKFLVENGAHLYEKGDKDGYTPISAAIGNGHLEVVKFLFDSGTTLNLASEFCQTPLSLAVHKNHLPVVKFLFTKHVYNKKEFLPHLIFAMSNGDLEIAGYLINAMDNVNFPSVNDKAPLFIAAECGYLDIAKQLIQKKADLNQSHLIVSPSFFRAEFMTPLFIAAKNGHVEMVQLLLDHGAKIRVSKTENPIKIAEEQGHTDIANLLKQRDSLSYKVKSGLNKWSFLKSDNNNVNMQSDKKDGNTLKASKS